MKRQSGLAMIMALLLVAAAAVLALTAANRSRNVAGEQVLDGARVAAQAAANGGLERARWALARDTGYAGETIRIGRSDVEISAKRETGGDFEVIAIARTPAAPFAETVAGRVEATLRTSANGLPTVIDWRE